MENKLYIEMLNNSALALKFKKETLGVFKKKAIKSLDKLGEILHKIDEKCTLEEGKEFILELCNKNEEWYYNATLNYSKYLSFNNIKDNDIKIEKIKYLDLYEDYLGYI